jgi:hypothetical protein
MGFILSLTNSRQDSHSTEMVGNLELTILSTVPIPTRFATMEGSGPRNSYYGETNQKVGEIKAIPAGTGKLPDADFDRAGFRYDPGHLHDPMQLVLL